MDELVSFSESDTALVNRACDIEAIDWQKQYMQNEITVRKNGSENL